MAETTNAPAAPAAADASAAPAEPAAQPNPNETATERKVSGRNAAHARGERLIADRQAAREARARAQAQSERASEQPRAADGTFTEAERAAEAARVAASAADPNAVPATGAGTEPKAVSGPPEGMVRVDLPEGHPLREQGRTHFDVPAADELHQRALVNAVTRRAEVEAAAQREAEANARAARLEAELRFVRERGNEFWTPEDQFLYDDIIKSYTPTLGAEGAKARADAFKRGREREAQSAIQSVHEEAELQAIADYWNNEGQVFRQAAHQRLPQLFEGLTSGEVAEAIDMYATRLASVERQAWENNKHLMSRAEFDRRFAQAMRYSDKDFFAVTRDYLETRPGVIQARRAKEQQAELQRRQVQADAELAARDKLKGAAARHRTNPQRELGGAVPSASVSSEPEQPDRTKQSPDEIRRSGRENARRLGQAIGGKR